MWKLFLDDERFPVDGDMVIARNYDEACALVDEKGMPSFISFDHDLGEGKNGHDFAWYIIQSVLDGYLLPAGFSYVVHSENPVGARNIRELMDSLLSSDHVIYANDPAFGDYSND